MLVIGISYFLNKAAKWITRLSVICEAEQSDTRREIDPDPVSCPSTTTASIYYICLTTPSKISFESQTSPYNSILGTGLSLETMNWRIFLAWFNIILWLWYMRGEDFDCLVI